MPTSTWTNSIDKLTQSFVSEFGKLDAPMLNNKPNATTWSVAQNIDHIIAVNRTYFDVPNAVRSGQYKLPFMAKLGFMVRFFGNFILKSVAPDRKKKIRTFPIWEPSQSDISADIVQRFVEHQEELKKLILSSRDLIEKRTIISSPANKNIVYTIDKAFDIIVSHEWRHFEQAKEVLEQIKN